MTLDDFTRHAEAWGGDIARWPEKLRAEATRLSASPEAAAILVRERAFDASLQECVQEVAQPRVDQAIHRVVNALAAQPPRPRFAASLSRWLLPAAGLACAVAIGAIAATVGPLAAGGPEDGPGVLTMIFDATSLGQGFAL